MSRDAGQVDEGDMKSQDIGVLLKLVCLQSHDASSNALEAWPHDWRDWEEVAEGRNFQDDEDPDFFETSPYSVRAMEYQTGISKTQISRSINYCVDVGLARFDRRTAVPRANTKALFEFIVYGLKYVFPVREGELTRGIATGFAAPVLSRHLISAGEHRPVWPYAHGNTMGVRVEPLFKTATIAARRDPLMYELLALVDAIRLGRARESNLAAEMLWQSMELP